MTYVEPAQFEFVSHGLRLKMVIDGDFFEICIRCILEFDLKDFD